MTGFVNGSTWKSRATDREVIVLDTTRHRVCYIDKPSDNSFPVTMRKADFILLYDEKALTGG